MSTTAKVHGHVLAAEGAAFDESRRRIGSWRGVGGTGRPMCSCGTLGPELTSAEKRKAWHRDHKTVVLLGRAPRDTSGSGTGS